MENINCPVCGESNSVELETCQSCNQPLRQSTSELDGMGKLIDSGQVPITKATSELEHALPAWLKNARQGEKDEQEQEEAPAPVPPPVVVPEPEKPEEKDDKDAAPIDWLAGLDSDDEEEKNGTS